MAQDSFSYDEASKPHAGASGFSYDEAAATPPKRGITGWAKDIGASTMGGLAGLAKSAGDLYGLASGNTSNALSEAGQSAQEYWGDQKSDVLKASEQQRKAKIDAADGVLDKAWTAAKETLTDPGLAVDTVASNISTLIPGAIVGRAAQGAKLAQGLSAASKAGPATEAAIAAAQKAAGKVGTAAAIGTGAVQQATDVSSDAYGDAMKKTDAEWDASPQSREALAANGGDRQAAKHALSLASARAAFVPAAAVSVAANAIPGATYLERALIGAPAAGVAKKAGAGTIAKAIGKGMLGEGAQEFIEEGGGKLAANVSTQQIADPAQDLWHDVGENAGMGVAGGILLGGVGGVREGVHENAGARHEAAARQAEVTAAANAEAAAIDAAEKSGEIDAATAAALRAQAQEQQVNRAAQLADEEAGAPDMAAPVPGVDVNQAPQEQQAAPMPEPSAPSPDDEIHQSTGADAYQPTSDQSATLHFDQGQSAEVEAYQSTPQTPAQAMGLSTDRGSLERVAAMAVDSGLSSQVNPSPALTEQAQAATKSGAVDGHPDAISPAAAGGDQRGRVDAAPGVGAGLAVDVQPDGAVASRSADGAGPAQALPGQQPGRATDSVAAGAQPESTAPLVVGSRLQVTAGQDGLLRNARGEPFTALQATVAARQQGKGFSRIEVDGGYALVPPEPTSSTTQGTPSDQTAQAQQGQPEQPQAGAAQGAGRPAAPTTEPAAAPAGGRGVQADGLNPAQQRAEFAAAERRRTAPGSRARASAAQANPFKAFMAKHGVTADMRSEFAPGLTEQRSAMVPGFGPIFRKSGKQLDALAQAAVEEGFLTTPDVGQLHEMIGRALRGDRVIAQYAEGVAKSEMDARIARQRELEQDRAVEAQLDESLSDAHLFDLTDQDAHIPWDAPVSNATTEEFLRALGATDEEIRDAIAQESSRAQEGDQGRGGAVPAAAGAPQARGAQGDGQARPGSAGAAEGRVKQDLLGDAPSQGQQAAATERAKRTQQEADQRNAAPGPEGFKLATEDARMGREVDPAQSGINFSRSASTQQKYDGRIDALFAGGKATAGTRVLDRSDVMGLLGHPNVPLMLNERHLLDGLTNHPEMTAAQWKKVPGWLENPAAVYTDPRHPGRYTVIAPERIAGYPVVLAVEPNPTPAERGKQEPFQLLVTVFANTTGELPALGYLAASGRLLYADTKMAPVAWPRAGEIPRTGGTASGAKRILTEKNLAGWRKANPPAEASEVQHSFAGPRAATADQHALATAQQRIAAGEDAEAVRQDTGWHQGADGKWRYEISDADARLSLTPAEFKAFAQNGGTVRLGDLLDHPKLFAAYPALADMPVGIKPGRGASYSTRTGQVTMGESVPAPMFRSVLMHEIQHGIQTVEGFATGGAVSQYRGDLAAQRDQYRREAGEVEARNTQSRLDMGDAERRAFPPDMTADVAPGEQIVTFNGKAAQNAPMPANVMTPELARQLMALRPKMATKESVQTALRQLVNGLGVLPNKLGRVVVATSAEIKSQWEPLIGHVGIEESGDAGQALGFYDPRTKTVFMIADHIRAGDEMAVLAHELMHKHGQDVLGEAGWNKLHSAIEGWGQAEQGSMERRVYDEAAARVRASQPEGADRAEYSSQELFPYAVQVAMELGVKPNLLAKSGTIERWLGQVKAALREVFAKIMGEKADFNSQDLVNLAFGIAQRENPAHAREMDGAATQDGPASGRPAAVQFSRSNTSAPASWNAPEPSWFDDKVYKLQDKHIDTKRVIEAITKAGKSIAEAVNVYLQEELFHGRVAKRTSDFQTGEVADLMTAIGQAKLSIGDVEEFLHARHAREANALIAQREPGMQDGGSGMTNAAADAYMAKLPAADRTKLEKIADMVDGITAGTRQLYADYGLESQETVDGWGKMFQHYVPLQREDKDGGMGIGQGMSVKGRETKGRTGSTRKVVDILANVVMQRERALVRGEKNRVSTALVGMATAHPNEQFWHVGTPPAERVYDPKTDSVVERTDPMYKNRANAVVAKVRQADGSIKEVAVTFNESDPRALRMAGALKNLDAAQLEGLLGASAKITRYFAAVNTQWNPVFGMVNLVRDVQGAMINLQSTPLAGMQGQIARDTGLALAGIYSDLRKQRKGGKGTSAWAQLNEQFQQDGGQTGYRDQFANSTERAEALKRQLNPGAWAESKLGRVVTAGGMLAPPMEQARKTLAPVFNWLTDYNDAMENGVRLAAYKAALDKGLSRQQAASIAKNLTVNFNRKGQTAQQAGALYAFFNAAMQGTARIGQALFVMDGGDIKTLRLSKTGKQVVYGGMLLGTLQAMALAAAGFDDEDPPEFVRERSLIIPTGGKGYVSIPMPLGLHVIPGLGRQITEFALSGFKDPAKRAVSVMGMFADAFNPIGNAGMSMQTLAPTVLDPLVALTENKDYTGKAIARVSSNKALPGHLQGRDTSTWLGKIIAEGINYASGGNHYRAGVFSPTPDQIDYLGGQIGGGVWREASKVEQTLTSTARGEELPTYKIPLFGRFYGDAKSQASQGTAFYAAVDKANALETELKGMRKDGKWQEAMQLQQASPEAALIVRANAAERRLQELRREKRALIEKGAERAAVKAKEDQITDVMRRFNEAAASVKAG